MVIFVSIFQIFFFKEMHPPSPNNFAHYLCLTSDLDGTLDSIIYGKMLYESQFRNILCRKIGKRRKIIVKDYMKEIGAHPLECDFFLIQNSCFLQQIFADF